MEKKQWPKHRALVKARAEGRPAKAPLLVAKAPPAKAKAAANVFIRGQRKCHVHHDCGRMGATFRRLFYLFRRWSSMRILLGLFKEVRMDGKCLASYVTPWRPPEIEDTGASLPLWRLTSSRLWALFEHLHLIIRLKIGCLTPQSRIMTALRQWLVRCIN